MSRNGVRLPLVPSEIRTVPEGRPAVYMLWHDDLPTVVGTTDGRPDELRETLLGHFDCQTQRAPRERATHFSFRIAVDPLDQEITVAAALAGYLPEGASRDASRQ